MKKILTAILRFFERLIFAPRVPVGTPPGKEANTREASREDREAAEVKEEPKLKVAISSGHGSRVPGACGFINEVREARRVVRQVAGFLKARGVSVADFHDDASVTPADNLAAIVGWHDAQERDVDISVHFNSFHDPAAHGTEVLFRTGASRGYAERFSRVIAGAGTFRDRGARHRSDLFVLNRLTSRPAILLEICFISNENDANLYNANFGRICAAIADELAGLGS